MPPPSSRSYRRAIQLTAISAVLFILSAGIAPSPVQADSEPIEVAGRFATAEDFVAQSYRDIFGREPDGPGLAYWSDLIRNGRRPSEVLYHFIGSPEFAGRVAPVTRLHLTILGRVPTAGELRAGIRGLPTRKPLEQQAAGLLESTEFGLSGDLTAAVARILENTGESGDPVGEAARIEAGRQTLAGFAVARSESPGHVSRVGPTVAATTVYLGLLRRAPEPAGLDYWSDRLRQVLQLEGFIASVLDGIEYQRRFPDPIPITATVVTSGLTIPWDVAPLPDGNLLVTERAGRLVLIDPGGSSRTVAADFSDLFARGETGLMGLALDPGFDANRRFYTCQGHLDPQEIQVVAWTLDANAARAARADDPLVSGLPLASGRHGGCQLEFDRTGALVVGTGDAAIGSLPQDLASLGGKLLRVDPGSGGPAPGNPFADSADPRTGLIFSYGHRNVQGLSIHPDTGRIWSVEHGPDTDDEVNRIVAGHNYGWNPVPGYNERVPMTDRAEFPDAVAAAFATGRPTLALSGGEFLDHPRWGARRGGLAVASLKDRSLRLLYFTANGTYRSQEILIDRTYGRLRAVETGPGGWLYVSTSNGNGSDMILRIG